MLPLLLVLLLFILLASFLAFNLWIHTINSCLHDADALIILGYKTEGNVAHPLLQERLTTALHALNHASFQRIICSGGAVGGLLTEARIMKDYLMTNEIDERAIILEEASTDTIENLLFSRRIMQQLQLHTAVVVSNSFHLRRVALICSRIELNACYYTSRGCSTAVRQLPNTLNELKALRITNRKLATYRVLNLRADSTNIDLCTKK